LFTGKKGIFKNPAFGGATLRGPGTLLRVEGGREERKEGERGREEGGIVCAHWFHKQYQAL
jgi:hypothetical protein